MTRSVDELLADVRALEAEIQAAYDQKREDFHFVLEKGRARFSEEVIADYHRQRTSLIDYLVHARALSWIVAPVIYAGWIPLALLDLFALVYQSICFPVYGITKVRRSEYVVLDRGDLPYLNALQKFNCFYCGYANGLAAYYREIAARTEQYFCPIKHARRIRDAHSRYPKFFEFGDAESFRNGFERLHEELRRADTGGSA